MLISLWDPLIQVDNDDDVLTVDDDDDDDHDDDDDDLPLMQWHVVPGDEDEEFCVE